MKSFRLTKLSRILIFMFIVGAVIGGSYFAVQKGVLKLKDTPSKKTEMSAGKESVPNSKPETGKEKDLNNPNVSDSTINLSLDEWIGWKSIIDANGGLNTKPDSIYGQMGLNVNIHVINDATQSSNALIKGDLNAAGYTINRAAFLSKKFTDSKVDVIMPFITNYSNGGDGIIANSNITNVESLLNAKIGVPQFSEAHSLVVWFVNQSDLTEEQKNSIISNLIYFETPDETAKAFFSGQIDVAATWQPYLSQAKDTSNCHVLFSTENSTKLIMDGIVFRNDFAKANPDVVSKFIDGALQASDKYDTEFDAIREVMPMFAGETDDSIKGMTVDAALTDWNNNMKTLKEEAPNVFKDMCGVWESIGETVNKDMNLFDVSYMEALADKYQVLTPPATQTNAPKITEENRQAIIDTEALLSKSVTVNFVPNTCNFMDNAEAAASLDEFVSIAKTLDGTVIQLEGNVASDHTTEAERILSEQRAETVKKYLIVNGIDANRILTIGNGGDKPIDTNDTSEGCLRNRRTDIYFKVVE
ncbi:phosphate ABC transporter substrate-binding/OmpA family protein [Lacrimispora amygdalina]|uniref:phosphate ABC transporter substrate-binding/OmpA family protein n=1 Tax=Lacrimispora amygdalina TaxID=253257 RepID=UPI000BE2783B|nr:phosphate ABC transporter substrate-binding/OmpA family protein [Lacrimispora amygdalina]